MEALLVIIGAIVFIGILLIYSSLVGGLIFYKFYYWFLLPVFPEMPHITFAMALGLSFFTVVFKAVYNDELADEYKDKNKKYSLLLYPWVLLLLGWIVKLIIY